MAFIDVYQGEVSAGASNGSIVSCYGTHSAPISVDLDLLQANSEVVTLALRSDAAHSYSGITSISAQGDTNQRWQFSWSPDSSFSSVISTGDTIDDTNKLFYAKVTAVDSDMSQIDRSVSLKISHTSLVEPSDSPLTSVYKAIEKVVMPESRGAWEFNLYSASSAGVVYLVLPEEFHQASSLIDFKLYDKNNSLILDTTNPAATNFKPVADYSEESFTDYPDESLNPDFNERTSFVFGETTPEDYLVAVYEKNQRTFHIGFSRSYNFSYYVGSERVTITRDVIVIDEEIVYDTFGTDPYGDTGAIFKFYAYEFSCAIKKRDESENISEPWILYGNKMLIPSNLVPPEFDISTFADPKFYDNEELLTRNWEFSVGSTSNGYTTITFDEMPDELKFIYISTSSDS